jgi:hypothetical protein
MLPQDEVDNNFESKHQKEKTKQPPTVLHCHEICVEKKQGNPSCRDQKGKNVINIIF